MLEHLREKVDSFTGGAATGFLGLKNGIVSSIKSLSLFQKALLTTGIGVLVVAAGLIAANFDKVKAFLSGISIEVTNLVETTKKLSDESQAELDILLAQNNILKEQGKTEEEILKLKEAKTKEAVKDLLATIAAQEQLTKVSKEAAQVGKHNLGRLGFLSKFFYGDEGEIQEEGDKAVDELKITLNKLLDTEAGYRLELAEIRKAGMSQDRGIDQMDVIESLGLNEDGLTPSDAADVSSAKIAEAKKLEFVEDTRTRMQQIRAIAADDENVLNDWAVGQVKLHEQQKLKIIDNTFRSMQILAEGNAEAGKYVAAAQATYNSYASIAATIAGQGALAIPLAISTGIFGLLQVQKILSTDVRGRGSGGGSVGRPSSISTRRDEPIAPNAVSYTHLTLPTIYSV